MFRVKKTFAAVLAAFALFGLARAEEPTNDIQRLTVIGYRLRTGEALGPVVELGRGDIAVTCKPMAGVVYRTPVTADDNQNRFQASIPFGYKAVRWMRRAWDDRGDGEVIPNTEGLAEVVVPWDGRWAQVDLILIIEPDPARKVTFGKSTFGEGEIGHELGTFDCEVGDKFTLKAVPAFDDAHHVSLSKFLSWNDGETAPERTVVIDSNETYIARFEPSTWKVAFDAGDGTVEPGKKKVTYGFKYGVLPTPQSNGYVFRGWTWNDGEEDRTVTADSVVGPLGDHTLFAQWAAANIRIDCRIVSCDDGNGAVTGPGEYAYGDEAKLEAKPYNGSRFLGWSDGETLNPRILTVVSNATYGAVFTSLYYRVQFKYLAADGIKTEYSDVQSVKHGQAAVPPDPDLVTNVDHHVFSGWRQDYENVTANHVGEQAIEASYDMTSYRVRFNANGGVGEMSDQQFAYDTSKQLSKCLFKKTDKLFIGWSKDHPSDTALFADQETVSGLTSEDRGVVDLYAVWTDEPFYTVVFEPNGATNVEGVVRQVLKNGKGGELASNRFVRVGYAFMGWSRSAAGDKVDFDDCGKITTDLAEPNETVHLWAVWNPIGYTLELDPNGGAFNSEAQVRYELTYDTEFKINLGSATREGYAFDSWGRDPSAAVGEYADFHPTISNLTTVAGDTVTLYVIWKPNRYTVSFDGNGKTGGEMDPQGFSYGTEQALTSNGFTRAGYVFTGWSTNQNGKVVYGDGLTVSNLTATADGEVTLYAAWNPITYTVRYDGNGAESGTMPEQTLTYDAEEDLRTNAFVRTGHVFGGWEKENGEKVEVTHKPNLTTVDGAVVVLKAIWDPIPYTVSFAGNGGSGTMEPQPFVYGVAQALTSNAFKRTGHGFTGWSTNATSTAVYADGETVSNLTTEVDGEVELFAKWSANAYKVAFDGNGGSGSVGSMDFTYGVAQVLPDNGFVKTGYTFAGWDVGGETFAPGTSVSNLTEEADATVTVKATWTAIEYDVTFDKNAEDATGEMADQHMVYGQAYVLSDNLFKRAHYMLDGWMTNETGTVAVYVNGATVSNLTSTAGGKVSLFARWREADFYTVAFKPNGGQGEMGVQYFEKGVNGSLSSNAFTRTGYAFGGWATNSTGQAVYSDGEKIEEDLAAPGETNTLFATWTPNAYTVVFDDNGATSGSMDPQPFVYDVAQALTSNAFEKTGHTFAGWTNAIAAVTYANGEVVSNLTAEADGEVTLTAQWKPESYSLRFYDGESEYPALATNVTYGTATVRPPDPEKKGQDFLGWFRAGSDTPFEFGGPMPAEDIVLKARWGDHPYVITFDSAGGSAVAPVTNAFGATLTKPADPTKTGHAFGGWLKDGSAYDFPPTMPAEDIALTASWTVNKYHLTFDANGGSGVTGLDFDYGYKITNNAHAVSLSTITGKTGYWISGWKTNGVEVVFPFYMPDHAVTMVAQWSPITYTIAFNGNDATSGKMEPMTDCKYDTEYALTPNAYDLEGKVFMGWTNSVGRTFTNGEVVSNLTTKAGETVTLYAKWGKNGTSYSRALGTDLEVTVSAEGAWTADEVNSKVTRDETSTEGTLLVTIPGPGTLTFQLKRYTDPDTPLVATFGDKSVSYTQSSKGSYTFECDRQGVLVFSGNPDEETWTLSKFTWTAN